MYKDDPYAREFGINVSGEMAKLTGRVLDAPIIEYSGGKVANINKASPGKWFQDKNQYVLGQTCTNWCLMDLAGLSDKQAMEVAAGFGNVGKEVGMNISKKPMSTQHWRELSLMQTMIVINWIKRLETLLQV